jgi:uncharacterized protein (TIGR02611 family)
MQYSRRRAWFGLSIRRPTPDFVSRGYEMSLWVWVGFVVFVLVMVVLDLGVFHRKAHAFSVREALAWTFVWVALALVFNVLIFFLYEENWGGWTNLPTHHLTGRQAATQFFTGYPIDNLVSLAIIGGILGVGVLGSIVGARRDTAKLASPLLDDFGELAVTTYRQARRVVILVVGSSVLLVGVAMIVLPGPAILVIPLGFGILAIEFAWARRWLKRIKDAANQVQQNFTGTKAAQHRPAKLTAEDDSHATRQ